MDYIIPVVLVLLLYPKLFAFMRKGAWDWKSPVIYRDLVIALIIALIPGLNVFAIFTYVIVVSFLVTTCILTNLTYWIVYVMRNNEDKLYRMYRLLSKPVFPKRNTKQLKS